MKKTISVEFEEQSKQVCANVKIQYELEDVNEVGGKSNDDVLAETKTLMDAAWAYANAKSIQKASPSYK